jgi:hypothetical protein
MSVLFQTNSTTRLVRTYTVRPPYERDSVNGQLGIQVGYATEQSLPTGSIW